MTSPDTVSADQAADLVQQLYRAFLGREPSEEDVAAHSAHFRADGTMTALSGIVYSEEARLRSRLQEVAVSGPAGGMLPIDRADVAEVVGRALAAMRHDPPSAYEVDLRVADFERGAPLATVLQEAFRPSPAPIEPEDGDAIDRTIQLLYRLALGRTPRPADLENWRAVAGAGESAGRLSDVVFGIGESEEAKRLRGSLDMLPGTKVQLAFEIILGRGATAAEVDHFRGVVDEHGLDIAPLVWQLFADEAKRRLRPSLPANDPRQAYIFGSLGPVSVADWQRDGKAGVASPDTSGILATDSVLGVRPADGRCVVSIITSVYRGGAFIRSFLENITSQTIFRSHCELIIIDADSPEGEEEVINAFRRDFPNIVYKRMPRRIGIYEAWNIAVGMARGRYITNANVDDIRRHDSLEIQASILDTLDFVDMTYQDVLYSFEPRLPFEDVAQAGISTDLPIISRYNLMEFNSPHNAPMWRASLHDDVGLFNASLQSAADFEFWLRCRAGDKSFYKTNDPHVVYYVNPDGLSTRPDTRGVVEAHAVSCDLYRKLVSPLLLLADDAFLTSVDAIETAPLRSGRRYDIAQSALVALGAGRTGVAA